MKDVLIFLGLVGLILYVIPKYIEVIKYDCRPIISVGGCNRDGYCGIMVEGNKVRSAIQPVVGAISCRSRFAIKANQN